MEEDTFYISLKETLKGRLIKDLIKDEEFKGLNIQDLIKRIVEDKLNGDIDFDVKKDNRINEHSKSGILRPRLEHIEMDEWTIIPINRFKILSKYIEKVNTSIRFQCNDGKIVEYCPRYAYYHNKEFKEWFDTKKASESGIKYDSGPKKIGELPIKWFNLIQDVDYFIDKTPKYSVWKC